MAPKRDWLKLKDKIKASGMTVKAYLEKEGIPDWQYYTGVREASKGQKGKAKGKGFQSFVPEGNASIELHRPNGDVIKFATVAQLKEMIGE